MSSKKLIAFALVLAFLAVPVTLSLSENHSAANPPDEEGLYFDSGNIEIGSFDVLSTGTLKVPILNWTDQSVTITRIYVTMLHSSDKLNEKTNIVVPPRVDDETPGKIVVEFSFRIQNQGNQYVEVIAEPSDAFPSGARTGSLTINVASSIWAEATTYIAIVVVIIIIALAAFLKMRSNPVSKASSTKTFTQLDAEKKASRSGETVKGSTDRQEYSGSKKNKKAAPERKSDPGSKKRQ